MAFSRAEIELLIKARSDADQAFQKLSSQIKQVTGDAGAASKGLEDVGGKTRGAGTAATATGVAFGLLAERMGRGLVSAFQSTIAAANQLDAGLIGLRSVANAFKQDAGGAEEAAKRLASDGLLSVGAAATSLKNLLAAGFGLPEAVTLVDRFKDSAAFGRQASLDFGQAVSSATEGIKNGNSILVDNAGVTKNLSNILVEAGFAASDLSKAGSDASIRMALFNGIVKETNPQLGDAARYLETAAGKQAQFNAQVDIAQQKIGKALQPALAGALSALVPFAQVIGSSAEVLVPLGAGLAGVVAPIIAIKAASALGINSLADLRGAFTLTTGSAETTSKALQAVSLAQKGLFVAGVVTAAYQAAKGLGEYAVEARKAADESGDLADQAKAVALELASFTNPISAIIVSYQKWQEAAGLAREGIARLTGTATVDLPRIKDATGEVVGAMGPFQTAAEKATRSLAFQPKTFADLRALQAEFAGAGLAAEASRGRLEAWRGEITAASGRGALPELRSQMQLGVLSTKELSEMFHVSEGAIKFYETSLKQASEATKKHGKDQAELERETRKNEAAQAALRNELEQTAGVLTQQGLNEQLKRLDELLKAASGQGSPALATAVRNLNDEFDVLRAKALASGLSVDVLDGKFKQAATSSGVLLEGVRTFGTQAPGFMAPVSEANGDLIDDAHAAIQAQGELEAAYRSFGLKTQQELQRVAGESRANYEILLSSGTATTEQLKVAYQRMVDAQKAATGELPSYWQTNIYPAIKGTVEQLGTAIQGTFAQVLLGGKSLGDGFDDIWNSIKASAVRIFTEILSDFTNRFLKGMLGALSGQQGAFSSAFGGLFGRGGGGLAGAGNTGILGGLFGGGAQVGLTGAGSSSSIAAAGLGFPGGGGAAGAGGLGAGAAGVLGGLGAGAAGVGLGFLGKELFGGAGYKAAGFGAGSGAATGALIGSVVPGLGTAVGAIIGGLSGLLSGALGKSQGAKTNDVRDKFFANFGTAGTGDGSGFLTVASQLATLSAGQGGGEGGGKLFQDLIKANTLKELEAAIKAVVTGLEAAKTAAAEAGATTAASADASAARYEALKAKAVEVALQIKAVGDAGGDTTELQLQLAQVQRDMAAAAKDASLSIGDGFGQSERVVSSLREKASELAQEIDRVAAAGGDTTELNRKMEQLQRVIATAEEQSRKLGTGVEQVNDEEDGVRDLSDRMSDFARDIEHAERKAHDLAAALSGIPGVPTGTRGSEIPIVEGGAAGGVYANRPGLVLFGEGGQPEVGGPRSFFKQILGELGVGSGGVDAAALVGALAQAPAAAAPQSQTTVVPVAVFYPDAGGPDFSAIKRHLASESGINGNDFGLREVIEAIALRVVQREGARRG